jgi:hypothetical protein
VITDRGVLELSLKSESRIRQEAGLSGWRGDV